MKYRSRRASLFHSPSKYDVRWTSECPPAVPGSPSQRVNPLCSCARKDEGRGGKAKGETKGILWRTGVEYGAWAGSLNGPQTDLEYDVPMRCRVIVSKPHGAPRRREGCSVLDPCVGPTKLGFFPLGSRCPCRTIANNGKELESDLM